MNDTTRQNDVYRQLIEEAPEAVFIADRDGRYTHVNRAGRELLGYGEGELVGKTIADLHRDSDRPFMAEAREMQLGGEIRSSDWELRRKDGRLVTVSISARIVGGAWVAFVRDASDRKRAEEALAFQLNLTRLITDNATTAIFMMDTRSRCTFMNPAAEHMTGFSFAEVDGGILHDFIHHHHPDGRPYPMPECPIDRALPERFDVVGHQDVFIRKNGEFFPVEVNAKPIREHGVEVGTVIEVRDLSAEREAMQRLRELTSRLSDADRRKDEFLATLAHELRNPLSPIRTAATILRADKLRGEQLSWAARIIDRQVGHMAKMLDDLLDVARITRGKIAIERRVVPLREVIDAAVETARDSIMDRKHELSVHVPEPELSVWVDPVRVSQILSNLLVNAARYTEPGGRIDISAERSDGGLVARVVDTGIGMEPQDLESVFEMFSQGRHPSSASGAGLGIGLALSKALAKLHEGSLKAESDGHGKGSSLELRLPGAVDHGLSSRGERPTESAPRMRVMVVDDNRDAADTLAAALEMDGHDTRVAYGGRQALEIASEFHPDATILDIGMPDMTGYEVARAIRREVWGRRARLAALTGWGQAADKQLAVEAGFDAHLTKPADHAELRALLAAWSERAGA